MSVPIAFELDLEHGLCIGVHISSPDDPGDDRDELDDELDAAHAAMLVPRERAYAASLRPLRRRTWIAGRVALRAALRRLGSPATAAPLLADERGAPQLPPGLVGSISHKRRLAVAIVSPQTEWTLGVDIEQRQRRPDGRVDISPRILTRAELDELAGLSPEAREAQVLLRFSLKEAVYKAIDPFVRRFVAFREVSLTPASDGSVTVRRHFAEALDIEAQWTTQGEYYLTWARARRAG